MERQVERDADWGEIFRKIVENFQESPRELARLTRAQLVAFYFKPRERDIEDVITLARMRKRRKRKLAERTG